MSKLPWKVASTLIIAARNAATKNVENGGFDYKILLLKRSAKSGFMANAYVFPGGIADKWDESLEYESVFCKLDLNSYAYNSDHVPELYKVKDANKLLPEVSLRIAAIRETFEETGVLVSSQPRGGNLEPDLLKLWRKKVFHNADEFLSLCKELEVSPDIDSLREWSCWLTPVDVGPRRFDTMFYICCLEDVPMASPDDSEISELKWLNPQEALELHLKQEIWLAPPQAYEISRFVAFKSFDQLKEFASTRANRGVCRWLPVRMNATDGAVSVLPGDDLYPDVPDIYGKSGVQDLNKSREELRKCKRMNRFEYQDFFKGSLIVKDVTDPCGHVAPVSFNPLTKAKL